MNREPLPLPDAGARRYHPAVVSWMHKWLERHRHPASRVLHALGIPLLPLAGVLAVAQLAQDRWDLWWRPVVLVVTGYVLQWIGHRIEGSDMGEVILIRKLRGAQSRDQEPACHDRAEQHEPSVTARVHRNRAASDQEGC